MGTNPENEAQTKVNQRFALNGPSRRPFIESAHNLHELASHQNDRALDHAEEFRQISIAPLVEILSEFGFPQHDFTPLVNVLFD